MKYLRPTSPRVQVSYRPNVAQPPRRLNDPTAPLPHAQHVQPWPLHEDDVDLPTEPAPVESATPLDPFRGAYLGFINVQPRAATGWLTLELLAEDGHLEFGPYLLDRASAQRLCVLLSVGLALLNPPEVSP